MTTETQAPDDWVLLEAAKLSDTWCRSIEWLRELYGVSGSFRALCDMIEQNKSLAAEIERLREALEAHENHMTAGQTLAVKYLVPEVDPDSIGKDEFISRIIEHFDGPDQRTVQAKAREALEKQP
jgi:hypothetical protein